MKKFLASITLSLMLPAQFAGAVDPVFTTQEEPSLFQEDTEITYTFHNANNSFTDLFNFLSQQENEKLNEVEQEIQTKILKVLEETTIQGYTSSEQHYMKISSSEANYLDVVSTLEEHINLQTETISNYEFHKIKSENFVFGYVSNHVVIADSFETVSNNLKSLESEIKNPLGQFFTADIITSEIDLEINISEPTQGEFLIITETKFDGKSDLEYLNSTNHLYEQIPAENPVLYLEMNNFVELLNLSSQSFYTDDTIDFTEILKELEAELPGISDTLNNQIAILVDNPENAIPTFTIALEEADANIAKEITTAIDSAIEDAKLNAPGTITQDSLDTDLQKVTFEFLEEVPAEIIETIGKKHELTYGIIDDTYVVSNNPTLAEDFGNLSKSVANTAVTSNKLEYPTNGNISVSYLSFENLALWLGNLFEAGTTIDNQEIPAEVNEFLAVLEKFGELNGVSYADGETLWEEAKLELPIQDLIDFLETSQDLSEDFFNDYSGQYYDVESTDWYGPAVEQGLEEKILTQLNQGTNSYEFEFEPGRDISRAEFVEMIVRAYGLHYTTPEKKASDIFSDVPAGTYQDEILSIAFENGIINGDDNGNTMRPNDTLNRAEAVQILYNVSPLLEGRVSSAERFKDVEESDWYHNVVSVAVEKEIVKGINPEEFAPAKTLNKAEAIVMVIRIVNNEIRL